MATYAVKNLRLKLGLSQQQFATLVGSSVKTISNWENGGVVPASKIPQLMALEAEANSPHGNNASEVDGGNAQALGDGSSATVNPNPADLIAIIARYQTQIEKMEADARAERERLLSEARAERERLYALLERIKNS